MAATMLFSHHFAEVFHDVEEHGDQKAAGAAGGIDQRLPGFGGQAADDRVDQRPGGEILPGDEALEFGGILDLVLGLAEHQPEQAMLLAEVLQDQPILRFERHSVLATSVLQS